MEFRTRNECVKTKLTDKKKVMIYMERAFHTKLQHIAIEENTTVSEIARTLLESFVESRQGA